MNTLDEVKAAIRSLTPTELEELKRDLAMEPAGPRFAETPEVLRINEQMMDAHAETLKKLAQ